MAMSNSLRNKLLAAAGGGAMLITPFSWVVRMAWKGECTTPIKTLLVFG